MKKALITGITGQDGSYLAKYLLDKGYKVYGMHRRVSVDNYFSKINHLKGKINLVCGELTDSASLEKVLKETQPDEIYNLAAQSNVRISFDQPHYTREVNWHGVERLLDLSVSVSPNSKLYQASTSEMFGDVLETPQNEQTPFNPVSPYGKSKLKAHEYIKQVRREGVFALSGILFNHESPRRGLDFLTRKVTDGLVRIKLNLPQRNTERDFLEVGNLESKRDWGFAGDYVKAMHLMLQKDIPEDYVIATGKYHTVRQFIESAAACLDMEITWQGKGVNEVAYNKDGKKIIAIDPGHFRPNEVNKLKGDANKAKKELGWTPDVSFENLVEMMVKSDFQKLNKEL